MEHYVKLLYIKVLHGNYLDLHNGDKREFLSSALAALQSFDEKASLRLLSMGWREQLVASWLCGLKGYNQFATQIGDMLISSKYSYAGQGFCFALACFGDENSAEYLLKYLQIYLPEKHLDYDQYWAMAALMWIDNKLNTNNASQVTGLWESFEQEIGIKLNDFYRRFVDSMRFCQENFL